MTNNVIRTQKLTYRLEEEMQKQITQLIHTFDERVSIASVVGVLEVIKKNLIEGSA